MIDLMNVSKSTIERLLKQLSSEPLKLIEYVGSLKTGGYVLTERGKEYLQSITPSKSFVNINYKIDK